ncbi:MAG: hypothetical protein HQK51_04520 [Oligoflexia bacterium]|nr:hypothetical protein [Oligoflexia bacterium]
MRKSNGTYSKYSIKGLSIVEKNNDSDDDFTSDTSDLKNLENLIKESLAISNKVALEPFDKIKSGQMAFLNYLSNERSRLEKLVQFFSQKIVTKIHYSDTTKELINIKTNDVLILKEDLLDELVSEKSIFQLNLSSIFNKTFSSVRDKDNDKDKNKDKNKNKNKNKYKIKM